MKFNEKQSRQPRKQRLAQRAAPLHERGKALHCHLSKELRGREKKRGVRLRKGDRVRVCRGRFKKRSGAVTKVNLKRRVVFVEGVVMKKQGGKELPAPLQPSNLVITELASRGKQAIARNEENKAEKEKRKGKAAAEAAIIAEAAKEVK